MRPITEHEKPLLRVLFSKACLAYDESSLMVEQMADGGMGSLRITSGSTANPKFGTNAAECCFNDVDGVPVTAALYLDQEGQPFEVDVWKVDFSRLQRWPLIEEISDFQPQTPNKSLNSTAAAAPPSSDAPKRRAG